MANVDTEPLLAFVHINKTAGSTMKFVLRNSFCLQHCNLIARVPDQADDEDLAFARRVHRFGLRCVSGHSLAGPAERIATPLRRFTILRDPQKRCLSQYLHRKRAAARSGRELSIQEFLEDPGRRNRQTRMIAGTTDVERAKRELDDYLFVGLTERFDESLLAFARLSGAPIRLEYQRRKVTKNVSDRKAVLTDPASARLLGEHNELDQQLYDYARDELFPRFLEQAARPSPLAHAEVIERSSSTMRFRINRMFQLAVYRRLATRRRAIARAEA